MTRKKWREMLPLIIIFLTATVGIIDSTTPLGISDWMFFFVPIVLTSWLSKRWTTRIALAASFLTILGFFLPPQTLDISTRRVIFSIVNRTMGIMIFWITTLLINVRRKALEDLRDAHQELEKKTEKLIEIEKLKTEFLADTSHELRGPLAIIKSHLDLATGKKSKKLIDPYKALRGINAEIKHISQVIADLILLARSVSGPHRILTPEDLELSELMMGVVKGYRQMAKNKSISIATNLPETPYHGDREKLEKLFSNLLGNAIRYGKENGHIDIIMRKDDSAITIEFIDDGIGIPEKDLPYIFERFYRVEKARARESGGVGLGLAISKWITEAHGGIIGASSVLDAGSTFTLRFPLSEPHKTDPHH